MFAGTQLTVVSPFQQADLQRRTVGLDDVNVEIDVDSRLMASRFLGDFRCTVPVFNIPTNVENARPTENVKLTANIDAPREYDSRSHPEWITRNSLSDDRKLRSQTIRDLLTNEREAAALSGRYLPEMAYEDLPPRYEETFNETESLTFFYSMRPIHSKEINNYGK